MSLRKKAQDRNFLNLDRNSQKSVKRGRKRYSRVRCATSRPCDAAKWLEVSDNRSGVAHRIATNVAYRLLYARFSPSCMESKMVYIKDVPNVHFEWCTFES